MKDAAEAQLTQSIFLHSLPTRRYASADNSCRRVSLCVCVSVTRQYRIKTAARVELFFAYRFFSNYAIRCISRRLEYIQDKGYFPPNFVPNSGLWKFRHGTPTISECDITATADGLVLTAPGGDGPTNHRLWILYSTRHAALCTARWSIGRVGTVARVLSAW